MGKVVKYSSVSVDGFTADEHDQPGPLFDWLSNGDVPLDERGEVKVSQTSYDYTRPYVGPDRGDNRRPSRLRPDGRLGREASERDRPRGGRDAPAGARGLGPRGPVSLCRRRRGSRGQGAGAGGDRIVEVAAGDVGGQVLAAGLVDEVRMDVVPVVFGSGKRYFGSVHAQHLLEDPDVVIQGNRVLHLRYRVRR